MSGYMEMDFHQVLRLLCCNQFSGSCFLKCRCKGKRTTKKKIVFKSMDFSAFFSEITPVRIRSSAPIPPEIQSFNTDLVFENHCQQCKHQDYQ